MVLQQTLKNALKTGFVTRSETGQTPLHWAMESCDCRAAGLRGFERPRYLWCKRDF